MRSMRTRTTLTILTAALALTLTACGSDNSTVNDAGATSAPSTATTDNGISAEHNAVDVTFISDMTPHHGAAIAMAELVATRASSPQVKDLAQRILGAQKPEIDKMAAMAKAWGVTLAAGDGGHGMGGGMDDDVTALTPMTGAAFDKEFLTRMTAHHQSALPMAQADLDGGQNPQAKALATAIIAAQTKEIAEMKTLLAAA